MSEEGFFFEFAVDCEKNLIVQKNSFCWNTWPKDIFKITMDASSYLVAVHKMPSIFMCW